MGSAVRITLTVDGGDTFDRTYDASAMLYSEMIAHLFFVAEMPERFTVNMTFPERTVTTEELSALLAPIGWDKV